MDKYYRVVKDNFMWEVGAILKLDRSIGSEGGYKAVEDIWDKVKLRSEYISAHIIEEQPEFFQRVYKNKLDQTIFNTAEELKKIYNKLVPETK